MAGYRWDWRGFMCCQTRSFEITMPRGRFNPLHKWNISRQRLHHPSKLTMARSLRPLCSGNRFLNAVKELMHAPIAGVVTNRANIRYTVPEI